MIKTLKTKWIITILSAALLLTCITSAHAGVTRERQPEIYCEFSSSHAPIDKERVSILLDGKDVTSGAKIEAWRVSYRPPEPLEAGVHSVKVTVYDLNGSMGLKKWNFTIDPNAGDTKRPVVSYIAPTPGNGAELKSGAGIIISVAVEDFGGSGADAAKTLLSISRDGAPSETKMDGAAIKDNVLSIPLDELASGRYVIGISVIDKAGNRADEIRTAFTIDSEPPKISSFNLSAVKISSSEEITATITAEDAPAGNISSCSLKISRDGKRLAVFKSAAKNGAAQIKFKPSDIEKGTAGSYEASASCSDFGGNETEFSESKTFAVDTDKQESLLAALEPSNARGRPDFMMKPLPLYTNNSLIDIEGRAAPDAKLALMLNGINVSSKSAEEWGDFNFTRVRLIEGQNTLSAAMLDKDGVPDIQTPEYSVFLDTKPPEISALSPADGAELEFDDFKSISFAIADPDGSGADMSKLQFYLDGREEASLLNIDAGKAFLIPSSALEKGEHKVSVEAADLAGNISSSAWSFIITAHPEVYPSVPPIPPDTIPPSPPIPTIPPIPPEILEIIVPQNGSIVKNGNLEIHGKAPAGSTVKIYVDGKLKSSGEANPGGNFKIDIDGLTSGSHEIKVTPENEGINYESDTVTVSVDI